MDPRNWKAAAIALAWIFLPVSSHTMDELYCQLETADANTLVIFDVDMVLVQPSHPAFQMANMKQHSQIAKQVYKGLAPEKQLLLLALMSLDSILIDSKLPEFLQKMQQRGIPLMALTANLTGSFATVPDMETWRCEGLKKLGIDFSTTAPYSTPVKLDQLPTFRGNSCSYLEGILFVNGTHVSKGEALLTFLEKIAFAPTTILFVDDREENLMSVAAALQTKSIVFKGFHFTGAQECPSTPLSAEEFENAWRTLALQVATLN